jgi:FkbM family methyltransferase
MPSVRDFLARGLNRCVGPMVPARARLAFNDRLARLRGCEPELGILDRLGPSRGTAVDAGANEGLYTYRLANLYDRVQAFEINPNLAAKLERMASTNVTVHAVGLSSHEGAGVLRIPIYRGRPLNGWASLEAGNCPVAERYEEVAVAVRPLDAFGLSDVSFVKADVEGHELELLAGARETLARNRPVILMEIKEANLSAVRALLADWGYAERSIAKMTGIAGSVENHLFESR